MMADDAQALWPHSAHLITGEIRVCISATSETSEQLHGFFEKYGELLGIYHFHESSDSVLEFTVQFDDLRVSCQALCSLQVLFFEPTLMEMNYILNIKLIIRLRISRHSWSPSNKSVPTTLVLSILVLILLPIPRIPPALLINQSRLLVMFMILESLLRSLSRHSIENPSPPILFLANILQIVPLPSWIPLLLVLAPA
jgi:hypothetical protein